MTKLEGDYPLGEVLPKAQTVKPGLRGILSRVRERASIKAAEMFLTAPCKECNPPGTVNRFGAKICRRCHY